MENLCLKPIYVNDNDFSSFRITLLSFGPAKASFFIWSAWTFWSKLNNIVIVLCFPLHSFLIVSIIYTYLCFRDSRKYVVTWDNFPNKFVRSFIVPETKFVSSLVCTILKRENIGASVFITAICYKKIEKGLLNTALLQIFNH